MAHLVFVYGTLKRGFGNNRLLRDEEFLGEHITDPKFDMYSYGAFPFITEEGNTKIKGELYRVSDEALRRLDQLEGHPRFYERKQVVTTPHGTAWTYIINVSKKEKEAKEKDPGSYYPKVESGFWEANYRYG